MALRDKDVDQMWMKLGYDVDHSGRHVTATLVINGKYVTRTKRSHGAGKLDGQIPNFIRQKMFLDQNQFARAYACPLKEPEYHEILKSKSRFPD